MTRRLTVEIVGGTAAEQADILRRLLFTVEHTAKRRLRGGDFAEGKRPYWSIELDEMATYDRKLLADAWFDSDIGSLNKLARRADIETERLRNIMLGEGKPATAKELNAICEELGISLESVRGDAS